MVNTKSVRSENHQEGGETYPQITQITQIQKKRLGTKGAAAVKFKIQLIPFCFNLCHLRNRRIKDVAANRGLRKRRSFRCQLLTASTLD